MRNLWLVGGLAVAAAGAAVVLAAAWLLRTEAPGEAAAAPQRPVPLAAEPEFPRSASQVVPGEPMGSGSARAEAPPPPKPPEPQGIEDGGVAPQPARDFSWKYGRSSQDQLERALGELNGKLQQRADDVILKRFDAGVFDEYPVAGRDLQALIAEHQPEGVLGQVRVQLEASSGATSQARPQSIQVVTLDRAAYSDLYELFDEREWLKRRLAGEQQD